MVNPGVRDSIILEWMDLQTHSIEKHHKICLMILKITGNELNIF
jgi:hypothetical protein